MKRVFVCGPMTGCPLNNYPAFHAEAARLRALGLHVENPAENTLPAGSPWDVYMRRTIAQLLTCDSLVLLPGWEHSRGATLERHIASQLGMQCVISADLQREALPA